MNGIELVVLGSLATGFMLGWVVAWALGWAEGFEAGLDAAGDSGERDRQELEHEPLGNVVPLPPPRELR